ncbi:ABC transporter substrate-binding protein [Streptomyces sp. NPDC007901]|uniref:ABC transporter substrate-binding protein n=1 Tax=Streptomyces sp. NPDC007901 TaxID=3364785 RepID=UPI0036E07A39
MKGVTRRGAAAGILGVLAMTACSNPGAGGDSGPPGTREATVQAKELTVWTNSADPESIRNVYERFGEKYGVKMNIIEIAADGFENQVQTKWAGGDRPDILEYHATSAFWALNPARNMVDLSSMPYVAKSGDLYKHVGAYRGKVYAVVTQSPGLFGIFYNKNVLEKAGLRAPKTYDDLSHICSVLKAKDPAVNPLWESGGSQWPTQILGGILYMSSAQKQDDWAQKVMDKKTVFDDRNGPFVAGVSAYDRLRKDGCFNRDATTATFEASVRSVADGSSAMVALGSDLSPFNEEFGGDTRKTDATVGFAAVSADAPVAAWAPNVSGTWYVPKTGDARRQSTALAFIKYATGEGYQQYIDESKTPPLLSGFEEPSGVQHLQQQITDAYKRNSALAFNTDLVGFSDRFPTYTTGILSGQEAPQGVGKKAQTAFEQGAEAAGLPGW